MSGYVTIYVIVGVLFFFMLGMSKAFQKLDLLEKIMAAAAIIILWPIAFLILLSMGDY